MLRAESPPRDIAKCSPRSAIFRRALCVAAAVALVLAGAIVLIAVAVSDAADRDVVSYWSAAHLLVRHQNPYDEAAVRALEKSVGCRSSVVLMARNFPPFLALILPLGYLSFSVAAIVWMLLLVACLVISVHILRQDQRGTHLFGYVLAPALICLLCGQSSLVMVPGMATFYRYHKDSRPRIQFLVGFGMAGCLFKPHLFVVFGLIAAGWIFVRRRYLMASGFAAAAALSQIPLLWRSDLWNAYANMIRTAGIGGEFIPTLGGFLRALTRIDAMQGIPLIIGLVWAVWYFTTRRRIWSWQYHGMVALLVSVIVPPYAWLPDEAVLLPAIFAVLHRSERALWLFLGLNGIILIGQFSGIPLSSPAYFWTPTAWLVWYWRYSAAGSCPVSVGRLLPTRS